MIDIRNEKLLTLTEAARHPALPRRRRGKRPHVASLYRYAKAGIRGVRLETTRFAGTLCTSVEALQRFCDALSQDNDPPGASASPSSNSLVADDRLTEQGI
jgi:hypothetical protein